MAPLRSPKPPPLAQRPTGYTSDTLLLGKLLARWQPGLLQT